MNPMNPTNMTEVFRDNNVAGISPSVRKGVLNLLHGISIGELPKGDDNRLGLCALLSKELGPAVWGDELYYYRSRVLVWDFWQHYTGSPQYPVPDGGVIDWSDEDLDKQLGKRGTLARRAYEFTQNKYEGEYGKLRRDLAHYLYTRLKYRFTLHNGVFLHVSDVARLVERERN